VSQSSKGDRGRGPLERRIRAAYRRLLRPVLGTPIRQQRVKLLYYLLGYLRLWKIPQLTNRQRVGMLRRFLRIDWRIPHAHLPMEIAYIAEALADRPAKPGEALVEAGCWQGGSSTKFSILCKELGYDLHIYDSFEGVEALNAEEQSKEWDLAGQYASPESRLMENLEQYGEVDVCSVHPGWFSETLATGPTPFPVRVAYIDCDLGKGTLEVLQGVVPSLASDGVVFSQDFHIAPVRQVLRDPETWRSLGCAAPQEERLGFSLARFRVSGAGR